MNLERLLPEYDDFECYYPTLKNVAIVKKNHKVGVVDKEFNIIIPLVYETLYLVECSLKRMIVQLNEIWLVIDENNTILFESKYNYNPLPQWKMNYFDASYRYISYYDGFIEHFQDKIVLITKTQRKEFYLNSESAMCVDDTPLVYFFDGETKGCLNLESGSIELDILMDVRKEFQKLKACNIDKMLSIGVNPYSLFEQKLLIDELKNNGVITLINLMDKEELRYPIKELEDEFDVVNISIPDKDLPSIESLYRIMYTVDNAQKSYMHCDIGLEKLGVVLAYYMHKRYGYKGEEVLKKIEELQRNSIFCAKELRLSQKQREFILTL